jgi:hypothetical protein
MGNFVQMGVKYERQLAKEIWIALVDAKEGTLTFSS